MRNNPKSYKKILFPPENLPLEILVLILSDLFFLSVAFGLSVWFRTLLIPWLGGEIISNLSKSLLGMLMIANLVLIAIKGNYPGRGIIAVIELRNLVEAISTAFFLVSGVIFLTVSISNYSRLIFLFSWLLSCLFVPFGRFAVRKIFSLQKWWGEPVALIGADQEIIHLYKDVKKCRRLGFRPVVGLYLPTEKTPFTTTYLPFYQLDIKILEIIKSLKIKTVLVTTPPKDFRKSYPDLFTAIENNFIRSIFIMDSLSFGFLWGKSVDIEGRPAFQLQHNLLNPITRAMKTLADILFTAVLLIPSLILIFILSVIVWLDSPGTIFFTQQRIGLDKKPFNIIKFRTMVPNADQMLVEILNSDPNLKKIYEKYHKLENDPRITRVGKWLRRLSLDELPQIFNILRGEMSFIGPRAYMVSELPKIGYNSDLIFRIRPGLTGWWQVMGRNETSFNDRIRLDIYYLNNWSLWMDAYVFFKTFWVMVSGKGR